MNSEEARVFRLITRQVRRGMTLFRTLTLGFLGVGLALVAYPSARGWGVACLVAVAVFVIGNVHLLQTYSSAFNVCQQRGIVYWVHGASRRGDLVPDAPGHWRRVVIHLRDGTQCGVGLPQAEVIGFIDWLRERNPTMRIGSFDTHCS